MRYPTPEERNSSSERIKNALKTYVNRENAIGEPLSQSESEVWNALMVSYTQAAYDAERR